MNPTIAALKERLESERNDEMTAYEFCTGPVGYRNGHAAATERLLGLLEQAVETITTLGEKHPDCFCMDREAISKEFLTTLADASGESKNMSKPSVKSISERIIEGNYPFTTSNR